MRFFALFTFVHNGIRVEGGTEFDPKEYGFTRNDVKFLKQYKKILPTNDEDKINKIKIKNRPINSIVHKKISKIIKKKNDQFIELQAEVDEAPEIIVKDENKIVKDVVLKDENGESLIEVEISEARLNRLNKPNLIKIAKEFNIDTEDKTRKELIRDITEANN